MIPRVLYLGYGDVGVFCLTELLAAGCEVVGVVCRSSDRSEHEKAASVYSSCRRLGIHCFNTNDANAPEFLEEVRRLQPDLLLSIQYDRILKPGVLAIPAHGAYNLHFGPLPRLRGCFPTKWAILENQSAGVTFHCIDPGVDSGDIIAQTIVPLSADETDETLYRKLQEAGKRLFREQISWLRKLSPPLCRAQDPALASSHPKRLPYDGQIDWNREAVWLERFVRAFTFPPYPGAKTCLADQEVELRAPVSIGPDLPGRLPGEMKLTEDGAVAVQCGRGSLSFQRVFLHGEDRVAAEVLVPVS